MNTKLVRFGARDYDPAVGRWTARDPILFAGGDTNLFAYVINDPVNFIDPVGLLNLVAGGGGSAVLPLGMEGSAGVAINPGFGDPNFGVAGFSSTGFGGGGNVSGDVFVGVIRGDICNVAGPTINYNLVLGPLSVTVFTDPQSGSVIGGTVGYGPSFAPVGGSVTAAEANLHPLFPGNPCDPKPDPCGGQ